ncbi:hypothetical protein [Bacillus haynesii]|uniref:hypothetical protein n=1 Tax=Bacillus haynesii TaxID=1925021 RepID=UPI002281C289|nr:hypothetical protein [Bacillus haynesii]MCY7998435.1 hypothetical protein [Bacillus haynesii]MCY9264744.1 hypothetical protein [Bacillus haynesii]MEC1534217.1 hypothetical protein [Bacillus haynesii]
MKTCTYCGSLVHEEKDHLFYCDFCLMYIQNPQEDGKREHIEYRKQASEKDLSNTTPELMNLPTIELLFLLKISRKKRTEKYDELCRSRRYTKDDSESKNVQKAIEGYQFFTKKMYIIENILI